MGKIPKIADGFYFNAALTFLIKNFIILHLIIIFKIIAKTTKTSAICMEILIKDAVWKSRYSDYTAKNKIEQNKCTVIFYHCVCITLVCSKKKKKFRRKK